MSLRDNTVLLSTTRRKIREEDLRWFQASHGKFLSRKAFYEDLWFYGTRIGGALLGALAVALVVLWIVSVPKRNLDLLIWDTTQNTWVHR